MRKSVGVGALQRTTAQTYAAHGSALQKSHIDSLTTQLAVFQSALVNFSKTHAADIRSSPRFRAEFARMCAALGVDPLASSAPAPRGGSLWAELLGRDVGDWYFSLAVRVVEECRRTRGENGGLIGVAEVVARVKAAAERVGDRVDVSEDDVVRAMQAMGPLGEGFAVVELRRRRMIRSVPRELSRDQSAVLEACGVLGFVTRAMLVDNLGWERGRAETALEDLMADGLVWVDAQAEDEKEYWSPTFVNRGAGGGG